MTKDEVAERLGASAKRSYLWATENGHKNGDAYVLACQVEELVAEIDRLKAPKQVPCQHERCVMWCPDCGAPPGFTLVEWPAQPYEMLGDSGQIYCPMCSGEGLVTPPKQSSGVEPQSHELR